MEWRVRHTYQPGVCQTSNPASTDNARPKTATRRGERVFKVTVSENHVRTLTHACMACTANLDKLFSRLINRQLTNLIMRRVIDRSHWKTINTTSLLAWKKTKKYKKIEEEDRREGERRERTETPPLSQRVEPIPLPLPLPKRRTFYYLEKVERE